MCRKLFYCFYLLLIIFGAHKNAYAQGKSLERSNGFDLSIIIGANFSQLDGDDLSGYASLGIRSGFQIANNFSSNTGFTVGLLYDEKGSREKFGIGGGINTSNIRLRYLSIPIDFFLSTDHNELIERNRVRFHFGLSVSRLFDISSNIESYSALESEFKNFELSPFLGVSYFISSKSSIHLRFERSTNNILDSIPVQNIDALSSFMFSLLYQYTL